MNDNYIIFSPKLENRRNGFLSQLFYFILIAVFFFMASLPFGQLWHLKLGFIILNLTELAYIAISILLVFHMIVFGVSNKFLFLVLTIIMFLVYGIASMAFADVSFGDVFRQSRRYAPFFVALLILASRLSYDVEVFSRVIVVAALISSISALILHFVFPSIIIDSFSASEEVIEVTKAGRMYWENLFLIYFLIAIFFSATHNSFLLWFSFIFSFVALFVVLSRTHLLMVPIFILVLLVNSSESIVKIIKYLCITALAIMVIGVLLYYLIDYDERIARLVNSRFFGEGSMATVYENAVLDNRSPLYEQYWESIISYFPFGQGLGKPFAIYISEHYTADISLVSFMIPFGILGAIIFFVFIKNIFTLIEKAPNHSYFATRLRGALFIMTWIWILASFNDDVFSRKDSVIYLAIFSVLTFSSNSRKMVGKR